MKTPHSQSGFSLIETLVAITILLLVITGPIAISSQSARSASFSSEQVTAFLLAQEGVELIQKARDDLLVRSFATGASGTELTPWAMFTSLTQSRYASCFERAGTPNTSERCGLSIATHNGAAVSDITVTNCSTLTNCTLYRTSNSQRSRFTHSASGAEQTKFIRYIVLESVNPNEVKVTSTVLWRQGSIQEDQSVVVESRLFNIYGN